jgi:uncharacterized protein
LNLPNRSTTDSLNRHRPTLGEAPSKRTRLLAIARFLIFAVIMGLFLVGLQAALSRAPVARPLLKQVEAGTLTPAVVWIIDGIGCFALALFAILAAKLEKRPVGVYGLQFGDAFKKRFLQGALWGVILMSLDIGITWLLAGFSFGGIALPAEKIVEYGTVWAGAFLLAGLFEEYLYRGYALYTLSLGVGFWPAAILLATLFGGLHLMNAGEGVFGALNVMIYALFASFTLRRTGSLWFAVGLHAAWDFSQTFLYSVPVSGLQAKGVLLHSTMHGKAWLTGGSVGPEGSAVGVGVLIGSFLLFAKVFPEDARIRP